MTGSFSFDITKAEWINSIPEIMAKFVLIQVTKIKSQPVWIFDTFGITYMKNGIFISFEIN